MLFKYKLKFNKIIPYFFYILLFLISCDSAPSPYKQINKSKLKSSNLQTHNQENIPWHPPLIKPSTSERISDLPEYLRPRPSVFSVKMWKLIQKNYDLFVEFRRHLHSHPELPHREVNTGKYLSEQLKSMGLKIVGPVGLTGVAALLEGRKNGKTVAIIAEMDGSPITETTGLPFTSRDEGYWEGRKTKVFHAYGHDIEMAISLGTARILSIMGNKFKGNVLFIFQPASNKVQTGEKPGAKEILNSGILVRQNVEALFYFPLDPDLKTGKIGIPTGNIYGGITKFSIIIQGNKRKICSGNVPWKCVDPIAVASHLINELLILSSKHFSPEHQLVLNIGTIKGGESSHLVAKKVKITGTYRWLIKSDHKKMKFYIKRLMLGLSKASGTKIKVAFKIGKHTKTGNSELVKWALPTLVRSLSRKGILPSDPLANSGDFVLYSKHYPTAMFLLGCSSKKRYAKSRGSSSFNPDEETISVGIHILSNLLMDYMISPPDISNKIKKYRSYPSEFSK